MVEINLLPWRVLVRKKKLKTIYLIYILGMFITLIVAMSIYGFLFHELNTHRRIYEKQLALLPANNSQHQRQAEAYFKEHAKQNELIFSLFHQLFSMQETILLTDILSNEKSISLKGRAQSIEALKRFMSAVVSMKQVDYVKLVSIETIGSVMQFHIAIMER